MHAKVREFGRARRVRPRQEQAHVPLPPLPPDTEVAPSGPCTVSLRTSAPSHVLGLLLPWAHAAGAPELADLRVHRPTLEDIYLSLIDR
ncbi:hypothetical protein ACM614_09055, partial [Streptomyces sp. 12297]